MATTGGFVRLGELARTRGGDKGNRSNIGVAAVDPQAYAWLERYLTAAAVAAFFAPMGVGEVVRYTIPGLSAFNFVIDQALAGGASRSCRIDTQGKALGVVMMELPVPDPRAVEADP